MTTIAVSTETPEIICPSWCTVTYAEHVADLPNQEGFVIHRSAGRDGVSHSRCAYVDNVLEPGTEPQIFVDGPSADGISLNQAEALARRILAAVEEARA
ncbi:MAG TPA: hypothetical protein VNS81_06610 [Nocardioides sp.]|nr:hypothetical protein [Nocardioides sp.]